MKYGQALMFSLRAQKCTVCQLSSFMNFLTQGYKQNWSGWEIQKLYSAQLRVLRFQQKDTLWLWVKEKKVNFH